MIKQSEVIFICDKCGKELCYNPNWEEVSDMDSMTTKNGTWNIDLGQAGYGSQMDGDYIKFDLCDDCLFKFINTFKHKDRIIE